MKKKISANGLIPLLAGLILFFASANPINAQYTKLLDFVGVATGIHPRGSLISDGTFLYGMTKDDGTSNFGTIFKIKPDGTAYSKLLDFAGTANGSNPYDSFIYDGTFLYGMTYGGGANSFGTIFKIKTDGTGYAKLHDFGSGTDGGAPYGSLFSDGTFLYGTTSLGGTIGIGTIFKIKPDGTGYTKIFDFNNTNGSNPYGSFISDGTFLYGMTRGGGTTGLGTIFKIKPDGTGHAILLDFTGTANGSNSRSSLISDGTYLYGMTEQGGTGTIGVIFKIKPDGTGYVKLLDFSGVVNGRYPAGSLISDGTFLYGMANGGGNNNLGTIFKIKTDGTGFTKLLDFAGAANGSAPYGSFISDGTYLYGMTEQGGTNSNGTLFKIELATGIAENGTETDFSIYPNPFSTYTTLSVKSPSNFLKNATLTVYNSLGQQVKQFAIHNSDSFIIRRDNLPSGLYFIRLTQDNTVLTSDKLIITGY